MNKPAIIERLKQPGWSAAVVFMTSTVLTLLFWKVAASSVNADATDFHASYRPAAINLLQGKGLVDEAGAAATRYPPGYPVILAAVLGAARLTGMSEATALSLFNLLAMGGVAVLVFLLARRLWQPAAAFMAALAWVTYPLALSLTTWPNTELPFLVALLGTLMLYLHALKRETPDWRLFLLCGLLVGFTMLIRPIAVMLGLLLTLGAWRALQSRPIRLRTAVAVAILAGNAVAVLPWEAWAYAKTGKVIPLSTGGVPSMRDGLTFGVAKKGYRKGTYVPEDVADIMREAQREYPKLQSFGDITSFVARQGAEHPVAMLKLVMLKAARCWYGTDSQRWDLPILCLQIVYILALVLASRSAWKMGGELRVWTAGVWILVIYFWLMNALALPIVRYTVPSMGLLFLLAPALLVARREEVEVSRGEEAAPVSSFMETGSALTRIGAS